MDPKTHDIKDHDLHRTLLSISFFILDDFDTDNFVRFQVLALDNLPKSALTQHIQNEILISFTSQYIVNIEDVI